MHGGIKYSGWAASYSYFTDCFFFPRPMAEELKEVKMDYLEEDHPPVFKQGCPFAEIEDKQDVVEKCPGFKDGCPFKDAKSLEEVYQKLSNVPHIPGHDEKLTEIVKKIHDTAENLEEKFGECPVFHSDHGCPFKSILNNEGKRLAYPVQSIGHGKVGA